MRDLKAMVVGGVFIKAAFGLLLAALFVGTGLYWCNLKEGAAKAAANEPILGADFGASREASRAALKSYKRLEGERFQIPIDQAMRLVVQEKGAAAAAPEQGVR
ncbi:hypothetical protein KKF91_00960 [Myxococcota bacterium]|nr:hypothetical protein [Myxococcota bacterium]MBU1429104.1 hypothetical protein [Myxococcota bacterium]MBU1899752.1 hypothetical protein [Myxococcota bacterium]